MPDPFQPKFVDLVRNVTTTTGTGNFVLGGAISGFTSFSPAIAAGESFYYSVIGVDKPGEREVGRGTMQANGSIAREAISGGLTNFTPGVKTIALIAAAEWFNAVQAGSGSGSGSGGSGAATRAALAALTSTVMPVILSEAGREGVFVFDSSNLSAKVTADPAQGLHVAKSTAPSGVSGAWVRKFSGAHNVKWFGATGDGVTNDSAAFVAAIAFLKAIAGNLTNTAFKASPELFIPAGHYYLGATTLDITHNLSIRGEGGIGFPNSGQGGAASRLRWAANTTGIRVQSHVTSGASTVDGAWHSSGAYTQIKDLHLAGGRTTEAATPEGEYHGIHTKAQLYLDGVLVENFQGDGLHAHNSAPNENSNCSRATNCSFNVCRNGRSMQGGDANAWLFVGCQYTSNRAWGVKDVSFLGNTEIGAHASDNGTIADLPAATIVSYGGNRYFVRDGQAAGASTNAPSGTTADNSWWGWQIGGGPSPPIIPTWTNGIAVREGGAYYTSNLNANNVFTGCYSESGQGPSQFTYPTRVTGGTMASGVKGTGVYDYNYQGHFRTGKTILDGDLTVNGASTVTGTSDASLTIDNNNFYSFIYMRSSGGASTDATIYSSPVFGLNLNGTAGLRFQVNNAVIASLDANGIDLAAGKNFRINGTEVISSARAISAASVAATGTVTGSNLSGTHSGASSGTNTGDQTITLTGDVTGSGTGSFAATIGANKVTFAKFVAASAASMVGATAAGNFAELTPASARSVLGLATIATSGSGADLTAATVTYGKLQSVSATAKLLGRASAGAGVVEEVGLAGGLTITGANLTLGALTPTSVVATGAMTTSSPSAGNGYATGAGGAVTQATSKSTAVTLNTVCGAITMHAAALATVTNVTFTLTNSAIAATDVMVVSIKSGAATAGTYQAWVTATAAGSCTITVRNISGGSLSEALVLNFALNKAVAV